MQDENVLPPAGSPETEGGKTDEKPTLDTINSKLDTVIQDNERLKKQNSDKDAHISVIENENRDLRGLVEKVNTSIQGKTKEQKDVILEKHRNKLIEKGYDADAVDSLLETMNDIADQRAQVKIVPLIMEAAQDLVESDAEIDKGFLDKNSKDINAEYNLFKPELTPRKIKANLKKAYKIVKDRLADKARQEEKPVQSQRREDMIAGATAAPGGKRPEADEQKSFLDRIEKSGSPSGHFV